MQQDNIKKEKDIGNDGLNNVEINELLDKMIKLQENSKEPTFFRKTVYIVTSICVIMFAGLTCCAVYKNNFSVEGILSIFLAFFSIFISIFFYFKADETSTKFYDSSYKFMKDISVTLGKIEERFGEKLNSLNEKVSHLDNVSKEASAEIEEKKELNNTIKELLQREQVSGEQKEQYLKQIQENEREIESLKRNKFYAENEAKRLRQVISEVSDDNITVPLYMASIPRDLLIEMLKKGKVPNTISAARIALLKRDGYIDSKGNINRELILRALAQ